MAYLFTTWFTKHFKPAVETYCSEEKILFKILQLTWELWWRCTTRLMLFWCQLTQLPFCSPWKGIISTLKSYYLRNAFHKVIAAKDSDSAGGSGQRKSKIFWKGSISLDAIKEIYLCVCICVCACMHTPLVMSDSLWPHGLWPARLLRPWDFSGKNTGMGCHFLLQETYGERSKYQY